MILSNISIFEITGRDRPNKHMFSALLMMPCSTTVPGFICGDKKSNRTLYLSAPSLGNDLLGLEMKKK